MLDLKQSEELIKQLQQAAQPKPVDPTLPLELLKARRDMEFLFGKEPEPNSDLVHACLAKVAAWLTPM
jgi:hypothetical protein